jgi:hypothetical protein
MTDRDPTQPFEAPQPAPDAPAPGSPSTPEPAAPPPPPAAAQPLPPQPPMVSPPADAPPTPIGAPAPATSTPPPTAQAQPPAAAPAPQPGTPSAWSPPGPESYGGPLPATGGAIPPSGADVAVAPIAGQPRRANPLRWVVALLVVAVVVAGGVGAALLRTSSTAGTSAVLGYAPADTILYAEARLDLPGSQRAEVAKTLAAFPGFADQSSLDAKLGELYDRIIRAATNDKHDYQTEIAPWFGGQIAVAQGPSGSLASLAGLGGGSAAPTPTADPAASLPPCTGGDAATPAPSVGMSLDVRALTLASVTDAAKAEAWATSILADSGTTTSDRTCDGVVVHLVQPAGTSAGVPEVGWAILDSRVLVAGDLTSIRLAIATRGTSGLSSVQSFKDAVAALPGDHVGFMYEALRASLSAQLDGLRSVDTDGTLTALANMLEGQLPEWIAGDLKAADGNVVVDTAQPANDLASTTNRASDLAALAPGNTIALFDMHDLGATLKTLKDKATAEPKLAPYVKQLDDAVGLLGGFDAALGWIGDAGVAVTSDGTSVSGGILIRPDDATAATQLFTQLRSLVALGGGGSGVAISDEPYNGATITTVDLSSLAPLLEAGMGNSLGGMSIPPDLKLVYTATDKVVVLTTDPAFAKAVIDASQGGDSLAKDARFSALLDKAGAKNTGLRWVDVTAVRGLVEGQMPADARTSYDANVRPYLLPIDALLSVSTSDSGLQRGTMILSLKH